MAELIAVVGSSVGADDTQVIGFMYDLHAKHPDSIVISGGADGVDDLAERTWRFLGHEVRSYRPVKLDTKTWGIEVWVFNGPSPRYYVLDEPTWADKRGALVYRTWLIAEESQRLIAFFRLGRSPGTQHAVARSQGLGHPTYIHERQPPS